MPSRTDSKQFVGILPFLQKDKHIRGRLLLGRWGSQMLT